MSDEERRSAVSTSGAGLNPQPAGPGLIAAHTDRPITLKTTTVTLSSIPNGGGGEAGARKFFARRPASFTLRSGRNMRLLDQLASRFAAPKLTRGRMALALAVAVIADGLQMLLGPLGWFAVDEIIDVVAMVLTTWVLGFHILLLPTFVVEFIPVVDMLPSWTACVVAVIALRKGGPSAAPANVPPVVDAPPPPKPPTQIEAGSSNQGTLPR